jgi:hypothetical protein
MATRSAIGFVEYDGTVTGVYCHWDGYPEYNGKILYHHYNNTEKVLELIEHGDISSLRPEIGDKHPFSSFSGDLSSEQHDKLYGNMTTFYTRDRGEKCPAKDFDSVTAFRSHYSDCDFFYLYDGKEWSYVERGRPYLKPLSEYAEGLLLKDLSPII